MSPPSEISSGIERAKELIVHSHCTVALTGAGISTPSGIPDFRSPGTGLWARGEVPRAGSIHGFAADPEGFYDWLAPLLTRILAAQPNPAHEALVSLESMGYIKVVVTQNVDMLHQRAGSERVLEVHGTLAQATCICCYAAVPGLPVLERFLADRQVPRCERCGGVMKPNVILAGEQLPALVMLEARRAARACDVMLVAGTSLPGGPASELAELASRRQAQLIVVNRAPTLFDALAAAVIHEDAAIALPAIAQGMSGRP